MSTSKALVLCLFGDFTPEKVFSIVSKSAGTLTLPGEGEKRSK